MEYFSLITDKDIFDNPIPEPKEYIDRPTAKGVILDVDRNVCMYTIHGRSLFPGGGIEEGETAEQAFVREAKEETGCDIKIVTRLGTALEFRNQPAKKYIVTFFVAEVLGDKGIPTTTQSDEKDMVIEWLSKERVLAVLENQEKSLPSGVYTPFFASRTHLAAFKKYLELD